MMAQKEHRYKSEKGNQYKIIGSDYSGWVIYNKDCSDSSVNAFDTVLNAKAHIEQQENTEFFKEDFFNR